MSDGNSPIFSITEAASYLGIGKTTLYNLIPYMATIRIGGRTFIARTALDDYIKSVERAPKRAAPVERTHKRGRPRKYPHRPAA